MPRLRPGRGGEGEISGEVLAKSWSGSGGFGRCLVRLWVGWNKRMRRRGGH